MLWTEHYHKIIGIDGQELHLSRFRSFRRLPNQRPLDPQHLPPPQTEKQMRR